MRVAESSFCPEIALDPDAFGPYVPDPNAVDPDAFDPYVPDPDAVDQDAFDLDA